MTGKASNAIQMAIHTLVNSNLEKLMVNAQERIENQTLKLLDLDRIKCNEKDFLENIERIDKHMYHEDGSMKDIKKHLLALDHYLDKY